MYLKIDLYTPKYNSYIGGLRLKNKFLKNFTTSIKNGVKVFDSYVFYHSGRVNDTAKDKRLYKLLGTSYESLSKQNYKGLDDAYFYLKPWSKEKVKIEDNPIKDYVNLHSTIGVEYVVRISYTEENFKKHIVPRPPISNISIQNKIMTGDTSIFEDGGVTYVTDNTIAFMSFMDKDNVIFDRSIRVLGRTVTKSRIVDNLLVTKIAFEYRFTRKIDCYATGAILGINAIQGHLSSVKKTELTFYKDIEKYISLIETNVYNSCFLHHGGKTYLKYDSAEDFKGREFIHYVPPMITMGYSRTKCSGFFGCFLGAILTLLVIAIAFYVAGPVGGGAVASSLSTAAVVASWLGTFSLALTIGLIGLGGIQFLLRESGEYATAYSMKGSMVFLSDFAKITGYMASITGLYASINTVRQKMAQDLVKDGVLSTSTKKLALELAIDITISVNTLILNKTNTPLNVIKAGVSGDLFTFSGKSSMQIANTVIGWLNVIATVYTKMIAPNPNPSVPNETTQKDVSNNMNNFQLIQSNFENYHYVDLNAVMDNMPKAMTQDTVNTIPYNKYY